jgi:hypothetical protein
LAQWVREHYLVSGYHVERFLRVARDCVTDRFAGSGCTSFAHYEVGSNNDHRLIETPGTKNGKPLDGIAFRLLHGQKDITGVVIR